jgi:hypothetical protein
MQRKGYILGGIADWILEKGTKYSPLLKAGTAALSTYASFKDQQKKNQMQQDAYDDYMAQAEAAGHAARAAIDINYTPMTVSGVPTSKADVTDFTAVAAKGGLMSIPNKQRKRYAKGPQEFEVQEMDEEVFSPGDFKMETGVDVLGEQVFYDTGKGDRSNAAQIWDQMQNPDKAIFDFDFEIFFMDGGWRDMIKSEVEVGTETQMASAPDPQDALNDMSMDVLGKPLHELTPEEYQMLIDMANDQASARPAEGIMQAAKGGRIGYQDGGGDVEEQLMEAVAKKFPNLNTDEYTLEDMITALQLSGIMSTEGANVLDKASGINMINPESISRSAQAVSRHRDYIAHGGRPGYQQGIGPNQGSPAIMAEAFTDSEVEDAYGQSVDHGPLLLEIKQIAEQSARPESFPATDSDFVALEMLSKKHNVDLEVVIEMAKGTHFVAPQQAKGEEYAQYMAKGGRTGFKKGTKKKRTLMELLSELEVNFPGIMAAGLGIGSAGIPFLNKGGRVKYAYGTDKQGIMNLGGLEKDYRTTGGFVPIGEYEKKDDVPARLSKNEFVFTADAVRAAGGGSINRGAQRMYDTMKNLEASPQARRMTA